MTDPVTRLNTALEGRYAIERELGEGGMATVYLSEDLKHHRKVALKVLKPELAAVVGAERFLAEIEVTANLQHPNILPLHDSGEADGFLFYVMPYVEGDTLKDRLDREHQLPVGDAVQIATDMGEALGYAHRQGVIHRDIKPANVLLLEGKPVISDFGIALAVGAAGGGRLTETGLSLGTPHYMSPEQAMGDQNVGPQTDTYALGCVLYEMLVGEPPYTGPNAQAVLGQIITGEAVSAVEKRSSVPPNVDGAIRKALEKLPADRFTSAQDFVRALGDEHFRYGELVAGAGEAVGGRHWKRIAVGASTVAAVTMVGFGWSLLRPDAPRPVTRVSVGIPEDQFFHPIGGDLDLSRDGALLVYRGVGDEGRSQLWTRRLDALDATPMRDLKARGIEAPRLLMADGNAAIWGAVRQVWPEAGEQRCWNHKMRNVLDRLPQREQSEAKDLLRAVVYAPSRAEAVKAREVFARRYRPWYPKAVDVLEDDWERMVAFYDFPEDHSKHLRTTNVVESPFAALRLRTTAAKRFKRVESATALIWKLLLVADKRFRRLDAPHLLKDVFEGRKFEDGKPVSTQQRKNAA